tara:strand:+ start:279 stop:509 length:231 start_codon:yes stop_codon:yes gene_type:complete
MSCQLPEQTASYEFCLNDNVIMEGVPLVVLNRGYQGQFNKNYDSNECIFNNTNPKPIIYENTPVQSFDQYYKLLLK